MYKLHRPTSLAVHHVALVHICIGDTGAGHAVGRLALALALRLGGGGVLRPSRRSNAAVKGAIRRTMLLAACILPVAGINVILSGSGPLLWVNEINRHQEEINCGDVSAINDSTRLGLPCPRCSRMFPLSRGGGG